MRLIDYLFGASKVLKITNLAIMTKDDFSASFYTFHNPDNSELTIEQKNLFLKEINETLRYGVVSSICKNIKYFKTKNFDTVITCKDNKVCNAYPTILKEGMADFVVYNLLVHYNQSTKEFNVVLGDTTYASDSMFQGNIKVLEILLNYSLGSIMFKEAYQLLKTSKDYTINGINIKREGDKVILSVVDLGIKEGLDECTCTFLDGAFQLLIDYWKNTASCG